ncbi:MAG: PKD domain-containing protein [Thermoplasmata archaeon]|nr:PKD domain-containing protein [Thermoplasmata archaeon]
MIRPQNALWPFAALALLLAANALVPSGAGELHSLGVHSSGAISPFAAPNSAATNVARGSVHSPHAIGPSAGPTLTLTGDSPATLGLTWTATGDFTFANYTVFQSTSGAGGPWSPVGVDTTQGSPGFSTGSLSPSSTNWWEVTEFDAFGFSSTSNVLAVTQPPPAALNVTHPSSSSAEFNWTNNASYGGPIGFVSYGLYERAGGGAPMLVGTVSSAGVLSYTLTGLSGGSGYSFYLSSTDCYVACGQGAAQESTTSSNTVTFGTPLSLVASISQSRSVVDVGQADLFACNPSGGVAPYSFNWSFVNSTLSPGLADQSHRFTAAGAPGVSCEVSDAAHTLASAATSVTVNVDPTLNATANRSSADIDQLVDFTCTPGGGTGPFTTAWTFGDTTPNGASTAVHAYASVARYVASCAAVDATNTEVATALVLNVSPLPSASVRVSSATAAPQTPLSFTGTPANGTGRFPTVGWSFGDATVGSGAAVAHAYAIPGNFTPRFRVTDSNGISADAAIQVQIRTLTIALGPPVTGSHPGSSVTLNATALGGAGGPYNYSWTLGDGSVAYGATVHHAYAAVGTFHPSLVVWDRLGATNHTSLPAVSVSAVPPPPPLLSALAILAIAALLGFILALVAFDRLRRTQSEELRAQAPWVPSTDPNRTVRGVKVCRACGTANLPIRSTCEACGGDLPRWAQRTS